MKLLEPCRIGTLEVRNRIVLAPMSLNYCRNGYVTDRMVRFFEERAKGGVGLIVIGDGIVDNPAGKNVKESTLIDDDRYIPALKKLTGAVKRHGARIALQLSHGGRRAGRVNREGYLDVTQGKIPVAPSPVPHPVPGYVVPRELSAEEIGEIMEKFGAAAARTVEAGFDAVGLHCAHMYLCGEFLSPWANRRTDEYGGNLEGRVRFVAEVIARIRSRAGSAVPLIVRMNGEEPEGGNSLAEIRAIAQRFESLGVDVISVSVGFGAPVRTAGFIPSVAPMRAPDGCIVHLAENIKSGVSIPVTVANKVGDVDLAERVLRERRADLIAMGRALIADPYLPVKAAAGKFDEIVPCLYCGQGCIQNVLEHDLPAACTVNPLAGREGRIAARPAAQRKNVVVVGGGPGGLTAARVLAERGHRVTLFEKSGRLGGQMEIASVPPGKERVRRLMRHLVSGVRKAGVIVRSGEAFTTEKAGGSYALVLATGGKPVIPKIPGIEKPHVYLARDVLSGRVVDPAGPVAIIGGGQVGVEVAEFLAEAGKKVAVVELLADMAKGMPSIARLPLLCRLEELGVTVLTKARVAEIRDGEIVVEHKGAAGVLSASTVVIAAGSEPDAETLNRYRGNVLECYVIGDAARPRSFLEAIAEGFEIGLKI